MIKPLNKLVGLKKIDFDGYVSEGKIKLSPARLIPTYKVGDEITLTSIFLATLKLVKEFRYNFFGETKITKAGKPYFYTEVSFEDVSQDSRIDGLIIVVVSGIIKEAVFLEMKNKNNELDKNQLEKYIDVARKLKVGKMVTVSNQFVIDSSQSPIDIRVPKSISLHHFSWTYIKTISRLLLDEKHKFSDIDDEDQMHIMKEVLFYLESKASGVTGYHQMNKGWVNLVESINSQIRLKLSDEFVKDAVLSWQEQERNMSLMLSRELGLLVKSSIASNKQKLKERTKNDIKNLVTKHKLNSALSIKGTVSNIKISVDFNTRTVCLSNKVTPPLDKGVKARIGWIIRQLETFQKHQPELFSQIENDIWILGNVKFSSNDVQVKYSNIVNLYDYVDKDIFDFEIMFIKDFGKGLSNSKKFITNMQTNLISYYQCVVQHLKEWKAPPPKLESKSSK